MKEVTTETCCKFHDGSVVCDSTTYIMSEDVQLFLKHEKTDAEKEMKIAQSKFNVAREDLARAQRRFEVINAMLKKVKSPTTRRHIIESSSLQGGSAKGDDNAYNS